MSFSISENSISLGTTVLGTPLQRSGSNAGGPGGAAANRTDEAATVASEILIAASEAWRYHYRRRAAVLAAVERQVSRRPGASGHTAAAAKQADNLFLFRDDDEAGGVQGEGGPLSVAASGAHTPSTTGPQGLDPPPGHAAAVAAAAAGTSGSEYDSDVKGVKGPLRTPQSIPVAPAAAAVKPPAQSAAAAAAQSAIVINALLETHYRYHREMQQLLHVRGRRVANIMTSAGTAAPSKKPGAAANAPQPMNNQVSGGGDSVLPFAFASIHGLVGSTGGAAAPTEFEDPLSEKVLIHYHELAAALTTKHIPQLYEAKDLQQQNITPTSARSHHQQQGRGGGAQRRIPTRFGEDVGSESGSLSSDTQGTPHRNTVVGHRPSAFANSGGPLADDLHSDASTDVPTVENLLAISSKVPNIAKLNRSRTKHVIDLEHNVFIRLWKSRTEAKAFHRGLAALHEAKLVLMLPPSFAVPYSVLLKGPSNTAVSVTWLPPLESSNVVTTPPLAYTNFTNFFKKAWREAVYPNTPESKLTTVSLCTGADGTYYAINCGVDAESCAQGAGGMIVDEDMLKSPLRHGNATTPGGRRLQNANQVVPLLDARRSRIEPTSSRAYIQCKGIFQRVAMQLKQSYSTQLMYLSMMSFIQGALYTTGAKAANANASGGGGGDGRSGTPGSAADGIGKAVESVLEFATSLPKEETPLALILYATCGEVVRLATVDYVKRMTKKLINTTLFQPKLQHWKLDTRVLSDIAAALVTHILEGRDDPIALRRNLETKSIANVAVTDICSVWGMNLADAQTRYGHSRTLQLFTKAAIEIVLVDHQRHCIPELGKQPPRPLLESATADDHPVAPEVAEIAFGILQSLLLGVDARKMSFAQQEEMRLAAAAANAEAAAATSKDERQDGLALSILPPLDTNLAFDQKFPLPYHQLRDGTVTIQPGDRVVNAMQLGGWSLCYIAPLLHDPQRNNLFHLSRLVRILRFEEDEVCRLLAKAIAVLICANVSAKNFFDTNLIKNILQVGIEVIRGRCADKDVMRVQLRFLERDNVARHLEMLVEDIEHWLKSSKAREDEAKAERDEALRIKLEEMRRNEELETSRLTNGEPAYVFDPTKLGRKGQDKPKATQALQAVQQPYKPMKKINRRIYHFLLETIVDPVPQLETTDELLRKPYEPRSKDPEPVALPPIARTAAGASPGGTTAPAPAKQSAGAAVESSDSEDDAPNGRTRGGKAKPPKKRRSQEGPEEHQSSKFDVFFRTVALYRDEEHRRNDIDRLASLHISNLEVRFVNGIRSIERRLWLSARMTDGYVSSDDESSVSTSMQMRGGATSAVSEGLPVIPHPPSSREGHSGSSPPVGLRGEKLVQWRKERRAERRERRQRDLLESQAVTGKARRYRRTMQEMFPGAPEVYTKAEASWPIREMPNIRLVLAAFALHETERRGRAQCMLDEFEVFSALMIAFDSELWTI